MHIKLTGSVLFVKDIQAARRLYEGVLGQVVEFDFGVNIGFLGGLSLWQREHALGVIFPVPVPPQDGPHHAAELYFETETAELRAACRRLEEAGMAFIKPLAEQPWGSLSTRFYDYDGHIVELAEPMDATVRRMLAQGMTLEAAAQKTGLPLDAVRRYAAVSA